MCGMLMTAVHSAVLVTLCTVHHVGDNSAVLVTRGAAGQATFMRQVTRDCAPVAINTRTFQTIALHAVAHAIVLRLIEIAQSCNYSFYV